MRSVIFLLLHIAFGLLRIPTRITNRKSSIYSLIKSSIETEDYHNKIANKDSITILDSDYNLLIDNLRTSKALYDFILTFPERARKELSFSLFIEYDFTSFLYGILQFNRQSKWSKLPTEIKSIIQQYIEIDIRRTTNDQVTRYIDIVWCLGKMSATLESLPSSLRNSIMEQVLLFDIASIGREVSRLLYSLSLMQADWSEIPMTTKQLLLHCTSVYLPTMNVIEVVNTVYSLGRMNCYWSELPNKKLQEELLVHVHRAVSSAGSVSISNLLWQVVMC